MEGDILDVYGRSNGVETVTIDGTSYTIPKIEVQRAYQAQADVRDGLIGVYTSYKFDLPFIKQVAETIFGKDIDIRKPVIGTDVTEENAMLLQDVGMDINHEICCDFTHIVVTDGIDLDSNHTPLCGAI